ncbi:MAG: DUF1684 domain-containing protein [Siphonobacter aquaeclarae]|nr:DUF1684 domain-containing protein [Siphonobacter aquaeclarae]
MPNRKLILLAIGLVLAATLIYSLTGGKKSSFSDTLRKERQEKDEMFRTSADSPFPDKKDFRALNYFDPDSTFEVYAKIRETEGSKTFTVAMTGGQTETYTLYGEATFELKGKNCRLLVFHSPDKGALFIPFRDESNKTASYGGGRYLDVEESAITGGHVTIDFNRAYNPYCAYSPEYTCPVPPKENTLPLAVTAGEKRYHD